MTQDTWMGWSHYGPGVRPMRRRMSRRASSARGPISGTSMEALDTLCASRPLGAGPTLSAIMEVPSCLTRE